MKRGKNALLQVTRGVKLSRTLMLIDKVAAWWRLNNHFAAGLRKVVGEGWSAPLDAHRNAGA